MPRKKVELAYITDNAARKNSCKKRKESLKKKLEELSILCDIEACAIMYIPDQPEPELWPNKEGVEKVLNQLDIVPSIEKSKKMFNHNSYIKDRIQKTEEQVKKAKKDNREKAISNKISECLAGELSLLNLNLQELKDLVSCAGSKVSSIESRIKLLKDEAQAAAAPPPPDSLPLLPPPPLAVASGSNIDNYMMAGGFAMDGYVPMLDNPGTFDGLHSPEWFPDWTDHMGDHYGSCSRG